MSAEKRQTPRIAPYVAPCRVVVGARRVPAYLTDLSSKGARVSCDVEPPREGETVVIEVRFGRQVRYSRLTAEVKWVVAAGGEGGASFGLTFAGLSAEEQAVLESVMEELQRRASLLA